MGSGAASTLKFMGKGLARTYGAAAAGTLAFAANVADGEILSNPEKALGEIGASALVGGSAVGNLAGWASSLADKGYKGIIGAEEYNNRKFDKQFYKSDGYKMIAQDSDIQNMYGGSVQEVTQDFLDRGITDATKIREALKEGISGEEYEAYSKAGVDNPKKIAKFRSKGYDAEQVKFRMALAKNAPKTYSDFYQMIKGRRGFDGADADTKIQELYNSLVDFF